MIREARRVREALIKKLKKNSKHGEEPEARTPAPKAQAATDKKPLTKLCRLLYLQSGRCFFCGEELREDQASIEHLLAKKWGGKSEEWNEVVCHASLNATFAAMDLRSKFAFVIRAAGRFKCPGC